MLTDEEDSGEEGESSSGPLDKCLFLSYQLDFGELHDRDRLKWQESRDIEDLKTKQHNFDFKMNYMKSMMKLDIYGNYQSSRATDPLNQKLLFSGFFNFARCIRNSSTFIQPQQVGFKH